MKKYVLNKTFENLEESRKWSDENLTVNDRQMYNGEYIFMVMFTDKNDGKVVLTEIWTC